MQNTSTVRFFSTGAVAATIALSLLAVFACLQLPAMSESNQWNKLEESAEKAYLEGNLKEAGYFWDEALKEAEKEGDHNLQVATTCNLLTHLYVREKNYGKALNYCQRALNIRELIYGRQHILTAESLANLALINHKLGKDDIVEELYKESLAIKEKILGQDSPESATTIHNLANLYSLHRRCKEARSLYERALAIDRSVYGSDHQEIMRDLTSLGVHLYRCTDYKEAIDYLKQALALEDKLQEPDENEIASILHYLGLCHARLKEPGEARDYYQRVLTVREKIYGKGHPALTIHQLNIARNAGELGETEKAEKLYLSTLSREETRTKPSQYLLTECNLELAHFYRRNGKRDDANHYFKAALANYQHLTLSQKRKLYELPRAYADMLREMKEGKDADAIENKYLQIHQPGPDEHFHRQD